MGGLNRGRWGAYAGIVFVLLQIVATLVLVVGIAIPGVPDTSKFADYMASNVGNVAASSTQAVGSFQQISS